MSARRIGGLSLVLGIAMFAAIGPAFAETPGGDVVKHISSTEVRGVTRKIARVGIDARGLDAAHIAVFDGQRDDKNKSIRDTRNKIKIGPCPPNVYTVDGRLSGKVTLTPVAPYNEISIAGCGFGTTQPSNAGAVHIFGPGFPQSNLTIDSWTDSTIVATIDPAMTGVPDAAATITLVVEPAGKPQLSATGMSFYAARDPNNPYIVTSFPANAIGVGASSSPYTHTIVCNLAPCSENPALKGIYEGTPVPGAGAEIFRYDENRFGVANDVYHFEGLAPGFTPFSFAITPEALYTGACDVDFATSTYYVDGNWGAAFDAENDVVVMVQEQHCHSAPALSYDRNISLSHYFATAYVLGPRGLSQPKIWAP